MPVTDIAQNGPLLAAATISLAAGAVSFASPCVLPLVPGYLGFVSGLSGAELEEGDARSRATVLGGALLFVAGFATFYMLIGSAFGAFGAALFEHRALIGRAGGVLVIAMGAFLLGVWRPRRLEADTRAFNAFGRPGLVAAFPLGLVFGAGWSPCIGPTLAGIITLNSVGSDASAARGAFLAFVYALGLGLPFILVAVLMRRGLAAVAFLRRHAVAIERFGGVLLVVVGVLLLTGLWDRVITAMQPMIGNFTPPI
ncbi:MAG: cytochrome c-type biosis protein [Frankiaceae bacterium]|jgi:cytochrome c-type biogenesis protein|nr:cytochrome c-type biosis protein [Frankiaceae bacterium]MDQ1727338.1 cytochrome c-type biosis protein [Frankiaceae bacterium]